MSLSPISSAEELTTAIGRFDQMTAFLHHWTAEAHRLVGEGTHDEALSVLKGADRLLAEMAALYRDIFA
ncbi:hypothetical protein [Magnetospirillum sp. 15-1]|uniref:hypothetical protein n=1 Tax=Magnetospirillum sp. 15-1 TaxID=1979370 RepID=UPI000BBBE332|nr:hypothetical protein [Magnetospirillum sp. 15-1]